METETLVIKPEFRRYLRIKMSPIIIGWVIGIVIMRILFKSFDMGDWMAGSMGGLFGIIISAFIMLPYFKLVITSDAITGPAGWGRKATIPLDKIDVKEHRSQIKDLGFLKNHKILAVSGIAINTDRLFSNAQIEHALHNIMSRQKQTDNH